MSRVIPNANITIRIKGLAIGYYNKDDGNWEFIFLRGIPKHNLKIIVRQYKNGSSIPIEEVYDIPIKEKQIAITTTNAVAPSKPYFESENFENRVSVDDSRDARWIINLSDDLHKDSVKLKKSDERADNPIDLTFVSISDAIFYTDSLSTKPYQMIKTDNNGNQELLPPKIFGSWLGLDIVWEDKNSQTDINFESLPNQTLAPNDDISIYEIEINNDCNNPKPGESDFHYYYDYLIDMPQEFRDYVPVRNSSASRNLLALAGSEGTDPKDDCCAAIGSVFVGITSLKELL